MTHSRERGTLWDMATAVEIQWMLRQAGLRVTRPRVAVLTAVYAHPHADTDEIGDAGPEGQVPRIEQHETVLGVE